MRTLLALLLLFAPNHVVAAPIDNAVAAATAAKQANDFVAMEAALNQALALRPQHPRWSYHLAEIGRASWRERV